MECREPSADRGAGNALTRRRPSRVAALAGATALAALTWRCADAGGPVVVPEPVDVAAATITAADMGHWISVLADDSMRGRQTPSPELDKVAVIAANAFQSAGLRALFGPDFMQYYAVPKVTGETAQNVAAWREGRDPGYRAEYVVFVAHMDHIGVGQPVAGDSIYNGADDNASGSSAVLEIAQAVAAMDPAPRRSVIVLLVSGEEHGFWGSKAFVGSPPVPLSQIVAVFNLDMVSRNSPDTMPVAGMDLTTLGEVVADAAATHPEDHLVVYDGPGGLSDHIPFSGVGIPWLLFFSGLHADYHRPSDEPSHSDPDKAARVARLAFRTGMRVAESLTRPVSRAATP